ncbi:ornithine aminotransferase [Rhizocola hellebori]|uniref:Ornithine aminotransferase n=1 Tax=Rhizocola hellebori TaxID=1392758 RepID=A0A8J3Q3U3_9ACTN|nr:BON domain-containing protein [Rhizocola hellebori]GIH02842.1 ornithine aminotransferase [Rhizocola hellebori]
MGTTTATRTDEEIQRDILEELRWDARVQPNEIGVMVKDGVVTLTGWVDNYTKKWVAERAAHRVRGVAAVANQIEIRLSTTAERTDTDIAAAAKQALEHAELVPEQKIEVTVSGGLVTLKGEVEWQYQRIEAERAVRSLAGVRGVTNLIMVKARPQLSPEEVKRRIEQGLIRSAETDAKQITVEVVGQKVVLEGTVRSWAEKAEAERIAWTMPGVTSVENRIVIVPMF